MICFQVSYKIPIPRLSCLSKVVFPHTQRKEGHLGGIHCPFRETWISQCSVLKKGIQTPTLCFAWDALCWKVDPTQVAFPFLYVATQPFTQHKTTYANGQPIVSVSVFSVWVPKYTQDMRSVALSRHVAQRSRLHTVYTCSCSAGQQLRQTWAQPPQGQQTPVTSSTQPQF